MGKQFALEGGGSHCASRYDMGKAHRWQGKETDWLGLFVQLLDVQLVLPWGLTTDRDGASAWIP